MTKPLPAASFLLIFFTSFAAQAPCPTIRVDGPSVPFHSGEITSISADLDGQYSTAVRYAWTVYNATIVDGQGTAVVRVRVGDGDGGMHLTASVDVSGLPGGCPKDQSVTVVFDPAQEAFKLDEYGSTSFNAEKARIDLILPKAIEHQYGMLYIIKYAPANPASTDRNEKVGAYIRKKAPGIFFKISAIDSKVVDTRIFLVPPGAACPIY